MGGCPGVPSALLWSCRDAPLAVLPPTSCPCLPAEHPPSTAETVGCPFTQRWHAGPPSLVGRDSARDGIGKTQSICVCFVSPTCPSYWVLVHSRGVWDTSPPLWLHVLFPAGQGAAPVKPSYLQAQHGRGLRCSGRALSSGTRSCWALSPTQCRYLSLCRGGTCCRGSAPQSGGLRTLQSWCSLAGEKAELLAFGGTVPSPEQWGSSPVSSDPSPWGWTDGPCPSGSRCYRGVVPGGDGVRSLPWPRRVCPHRESTGPGGRCGSRGLRPLGAPRPRAGPGGLRAVAVAPGLSFSWALRVPAATRRDGTGYPVQPGAGLLSRVIRSRFTPYNGAGTSPGPGTSDRSPGPEWTGVPGPSSPPHRSKPGASRAPGATRPPPPVYPPPNTHFVVLQKP